MGQGIFLRYLKVYYTLIFLDGSTHETSAFVITYGG